VDDIVFPCPKCGATLNITSAEHSRIAVRCPECRHLCPIPRELLDRMPPDADSPSPLLDREPERAAAPVGLRLAVALVMVLVLIGTGVVVIHNLQSKYDNRGSGTGPTPGPGGSAPGQKPPAMWPRPNPNPPVQIKDPVQEGEWQQQRTAALEAAREREKKLLANFTAEAGDLPPEPPAVRIMKRDPYLNRLAFSADGKWLAVAADKKVVVRDLETNQEIQVGPVHPDFVRAMVFSPDGSLLATTTSQDTKVKLWDTKTWALQRTLSHPRFVNSLAFTPDGKGLVTAEDVTNLNGPMGTSLRLWNLATRQVDRTFFMETEFVRSVDVSANGLFVAASNIKGQTQVWSLPTGAVLQTFEFNSQGFVSDAKVAFSPDGWTLAIAVSGSDTFKSPDSVILVNLESWEEKRLTEKHNGYAHSVVFSQDGKFLLVGRGGYRSTGLAMVEVASGTVAGRLSGKVLRGSSSLAISAGGMFVAVDGYQARSSSSTALLATDLLLDPVVLRANEIVAAARAGWAGVNYKNGRYGFSLYESAAETQFGVLKQFPWPFHVTMYQHAAARLPLLKDYPMLRGLEFFEPLNEEELAPLQEMPRLETLRIDGAGNLGNLRSVRGLKNLKELRISPFATLTNDSLKNLSGLTKLQVLHLPPANGELTGEGLIHLKPLAELRELQLPAGWGDGGLDHIAGLTKMEKLNAHYANITDAGLVHLKEMTAMRSLLLGRNAELRGEGLRHLLGMTELRDLSLFSCPVSDKALEYVGKFSHLEHLNLSNTPVSDAGLTRLAGLSAVKTFSVRGCKSVRGPGLKALEHWKGVTRLDLEGTGVTDSGLEQIKGWTQLENISLPEATTDAGLVHLAGLTNLRHISKYTDLAQVQGFGLAHLKNLKQITDLSLLNYRGLTDQGLVGLKDWTQLKRLELPTQISDVGLEHLAGLTNLESLNVGEMKNLRGPGLTHLRYLTKIKGLSLRGTQVTDDGLAGIKDWKHLESLALQASVSDAGLIHLAGLTNLQYLYFNNADNVKGPGLVHLKNHGRLNYLDLRGTGVTDEGLKYLAGLSQIAILNLPTQITDRGLEQLQLLPNLQTVIVKDCQVTSAGIERLKKSLPKLYVSTK
jgi:WD40 repeat protein/Leucine-rich repeat (LRR) protein